ncbi:MAG: rubrerythrin family protein [Chloroflexi bacterium]|nr:rubrerythrin family protein [Chloroflexota bacterium]
MGNTGENLQAAFAGESQANRRYLFFADKADEAGNKQVARLFRAVALAETVHARNHFKVMGGVKSVKENLETAIGGEHYEFTQMYPGFIEQARADKNRDAEQSFGYANKVEKIHHHLFQKALAGVEFGQPLAEKPYHVCQGCGNTVEGEAPEICPICGAPRSQFTRVD